MQLFPGFDRMISMKWTKRIHCHGAVYHAMSHGVGGRDIFMDDQDRSAFMEDLVRIARESGADLLGYCLLRDRFHVAIRVGLIALALIMKRLLTGYAKAFNRRHGRTGHLFQARYRATLCRDEEYAAALIRYIRNEAADADQFEPWPEKSPENDGMIRHARIIPLNLAEIAEIIAAQTSITVTELRSKSCRRPVVAAKRLLTQEALRQGHSLLDIGRWLNSSPASLTRYARHQSENTGRADTI